MSSSSSPTKAPPMKPPRLQKTLSISCDNSSSMPPVSPLQQGSPSHLITKYSPQGSPSHLTTKHSPQDSPASFHSCYSSQGSPALLHSKSSPEGSVVFEQKHSPKSSPIPMRKQDHETAKKSLVAALAMAGAKQRTQSSPNPPHPPPDSQINQQPSVNSNSVHSQQNGCIQGKGIHENQCKGSSQTRGAVPPKPSPPLCVKTESVGANNTSVNSSTAVNPASKTPPQKKQPLLPPAAPPAHKTRTVSQPGPISTNRLSPIPTQKRRSESSDDHTPKPGSILPKTRSHDDRVIAPEDAMRIPVVDIRSSIGSDPFEEDSETVHGNIIPVSPTSTSSGIPDDPLPEDNSPMFGDNKESISIPEPCTTGTTTDYHKGEGMFQVPTITEDTDGEKATTQPVKPRNDYKPIVKAGKGTRSKTSLKGDTSWIKSKKEDSTPPTSPTAQATPTPAPTTSSATTSSNKKTITPYRSISILPDKPATISPTELLHDTSKPLIGPSGQYYPPAVRTKTPDSQAQATSVSSSSVGMRKVKSNERVLSTKMEDKVVSPSNDEEAFKQKNDIPKRFKMTRRSNSFTGDKKIRPVSMMDDVRSKDKKKFTTSTTITRSMTDAARKDMLKEEAKEKKPKSMSKFRDLFSRRGKHESVSIPDDIEESSSDDDVGGTIARMPKKSFNRAPWEPQVSEPGDDDEPPEYDQLFEYVFVLGLKEDRSSKKLQTETLYKYPPASREFAKDDALRSIDQFCFPDIEQWKPVLSYQSENYSFVLTSLTGSRRFGYCRRLLPSGTEARLPEVYCIISPLGCFDLYSKILDQIEQRRAISKAAVYSFLSSVVANRFPAPGRSVRIKVLPISDREMEILELKRSHDSRLEHVDFAELYNTLGPKMLIQVFSSYLMERRIILAAHRLSKLSSCCHAFLALLYPFEWQHTFIPVLPNSLIDFCGSPLPFVIGISPTMAKSLNKLDIEMEEALIVDLDKKKFIREFGDESSILPNKLFQYLRNRLEATVIANEYGKPPTQRSGQGKADKMVVTAFMTVFAYFFGELKSFLQVTDLKTGEMRLQKTEFIKSFQSKSTKRFLEAFLMTQMFDKFVEERESPKKAATISQGLFEKELPNLMEKMPEIELFSRKKFWQKKKSPGNR